MSPRFREPNWDKNKKWEKKLGNGYADVLVENLGCTESV